RAEFNGRHRAQARALAELVACHRMISEADDDAQFRAYGLEKIRQHHKTKDPPEEIAARQARMAGILPEVERYVRTVDTFVIAQQNGSHNGQDGAATESATLLPQRVPEKNQIMEAGGRNLPTRSHVKTPPVEQQSQSKELSLRCCSRFGAARR